MSSTPASPRVPSSDSKLIKVSRTRLTPTERLRCVEAKACLYHLIAWCHTKSKTLACQHMERCLVEMLPEPRIIFGVNAKTIARVTCRTGVLTLAIPGNHREVIYFFLIPMSAAIPSRYHLGSGATTTSWSGQWAC